MSLLFRIVYAAHANGTHHKLALDALQHMERTDAENWRRLFLKHAGLYLEGSKAPDKSFKDFKNHVLHVGDGYWGGAPEKVEAWYGHTVSALRAQKWPDAAYAAGVLSHYFTDPIHPFHTGQTEAENAIHRAVEWSINRSYDTLRAEGVARHGATLQAVSQQGPHWLKEMTCDGAEYAHRYYEKLIAHYDFTRGVVRPQDGLDAVGRGVVAELLVYAADAFGHVLDRAIAEAGVPAPEVSLTLDTLMATLNIPAKWITKKLTDAHDRRIVEAMYDELQATGRVEASLPEDDRVIRDLHKREVLERANLIQADKRGVRTAEGDPADLARIRRNADAARSAVVPAASAGQAAAYASTPAPMRTIKRIEIEAELLLPEGPDPAPAPSALEVQPVTPPRTMPQSSGAAQSDRRVYLTAIDDLERAPSIGPKMAERFAALGIKTVADFLAHDPGEMAELLDDKRLTRELLAEWQDQAQLVMEIAGLRGTHAQLLTGAGYRASGDVAAADPVAFSADVLKFATSEAGKRILREGNAPDVEKIKSWVEGARIAKAA